MSQIDKNKPICDTDIWIKNCKCKDRFGLDLIFEMYSGIYMSDAVRQELARTQREEFKEEFELGNQKVKEYYSDGFIEIIRHTSNFFNNEQNLAVKKEFLEKGIVYDYERNKFAGCKKGLGEKVTIIYAAMLGIPIILSDDGHCKDGVSMINEQYPYLNVINLYELINTSRICKDEDKNKIYREINIPMSSLQDRSSIKKSFKKFGKKKVI